jgi:hypothetical protein
MAVGEWDQRQLCPDGGCVGVIGPDGTCKVCGRAAPNWGDERTRGLIDPPDEEDDDDDEDDGELGADAPDGENDGLDDGDAHDDDDAEDDADDDDDHDRAPGLTAAPGEWGDRSLCADGSCIGVLGAGGRCKACGRTPAEVNAGAPSIAAGSGAEVAGSAVAPATTSSTAGDSVPERTDSEVPR